MRIIIPLVFLVLVVGSLYWFATRPGTTDTRRDTPYIGIMESDGTTNPFPIDGGFDAMEVGFGETTDIDVQLIDSDFIAGPMPEDGRDQFTSERIASYSVPQNQLELRRSVDQYAGNRANQCAGEIVVNLSEGSLNVRSGPATSNARLGGVDRNTRHNVLLWAPDAGNPQLRWFLLVDEPTRTVRGWVRSDYCDTASVIYPN